MTRLLLLVCIFCACMQHIYGQEIRGIKTIDLTIDHLIKPLTPLPDSIRSYTVKTQITATETILGLNEMNAAKALAIPSLNRQETDSDLNIALTIGKFTSNYSIKKERIDTINTRYTYIENIYPTISVKITDRGGRVLFEQSYEKYTSYTSRPYYKESAAEQEALYASPELKQTIRIAYDEGLLFLNNIIQDNYCYNQGKISLYYDRKQSTTAYLQAIEKVKKAFGQPVNKVLLQEQIVFFEQERQKQYLDTEEGRRMYKISSLNLLQLYRFTDDFTKAYAMADDLAQNGVTDVRELLPGLHKSRRDYNAYNYYRTNGVHKEPQNTRMDIEALINHGVSEGYIILKGNPNREYGDIIDFLGNADNIVVKMKYQKNLNADVKDTEYSILDVDEVHFDDWHLKIFTYSDKILIGQIRYSSPKGIRYIRVLPHVENKGITCTLNDWQDTDFIQINDQFYSTTALKIITEKDCKIVHNRITTDYYTNIVETILDYEKNCFNGDAPVNNLSTTNRPSKSSLPVTQTGNKQPRGSVGISGGINNLNSITGFQATIRLKGPIFARVGLGAGFWGVKTGVLLQCNLKSDMRLRNGWALNGGFTYSTGSKLGFGTSYNRGTDTIDIRVRPLKTNTLHLSCQYHMSADLRTSLSFEFGYAVPLQSQPWEITTPGIRIDNDVRKAVRNFQPGGMILGVTLSRYFY
jgi:hypothetical protein